MVFLEFLSLVIAAIVLSQIILPLMFPARFSYFWLLRRKKSESEELEKITLEFERGDLDIEVGNVAEK